jgi:predicted nucleic acid-binding protein
VILVSDSSPLVTLARAKQLHLLQEYFGEVMIPRVVYEEVAVVGAGLPGAEAVRSASWIRVQPMPSEIAANLKDSCAGLGAGERGAIYLASALRADVSLIDEKRARRVAKSAGLTVAGSIAILERGARLKKIDDLRLVYLSLLEQGIRFDHKLLEESLARLGLGELKA